MNYLPKYFTNKAIVLYFGTLVLITTIFYSHSLPVVFMLFGIVEVVGFFYYANLFTKKWANYSQKKFYKQLFQTALGIRIFWVVFSYLFYTYMYGKPFEYEAADSVGYHNTAIWIRDLIESNIGLKPFLDSLKGGYSDAGYAIYLGFQYYFTGDSIIIERLLKAIYGAFMCILIYRLSVRNFGEEVGRMAAIFCMLMPNLIYYAGLHVKEVEMVLLTVWFMERADLMLRNKNFNFVEIAPPLIIAGLLFFFRTVLGVSALFALFTALMFSSTKVVGWGKRIILIVWVLVTVGYFIGGSISTEVEEVWAAKNKTQQTSMQYRSIQEGGNKFAKYATSAIFAPIIFIMPFPTMVNTLGQQNSQLMHGGYFVKNILAFFVILAMIWIVINQKWREYTLIISFPIGYLVVIAFSSFAQAERFHQPALPFLLIFAAFGVSKVTNKTKKYFTWYLAFIFVALIGWSWFKLAGRGLA